MFSTKYTFEYNEIYYFVLADYHYTLFLQIRKNIFTPFIIMLKNNWRPK